jgi:hypothetical protein
MAQGFNVLSLLLVFLIVLLGALLGAFIAFFLFRITLGRQVERFELELRDSMDKLHYGLESLTWNIQRQTLTVRDQIKTSTPGLALSLDHEMAKDAAGLPKAGNGLRVPAEAARDISFRRRPDTERPGVSPGRSGSLQQWLQAYATSPETFQEQAGAKAVSVRKAAGPSAGPVVYEHPNGRFWLFTADGRDWVIPKAGLRIDDTSYYDTGIRELFECPGYGSHGAFAFKVVRAARVSQAGDSWTLAERGRLELRAEVGA